MAHTRQRQGNGQFHGRRRRDSADKRHVARCLFTEIVFELKPITFEQLCHDAPSIEQNLTQAAHWRRVTKGARRRQILLTSKQRQNADDAWEAWNDDLDQLTSYLDALPKRQDELRLNGDPAWFLPLLQFALPRILTARQLGRTLSPCEVFRGGWRDPWFNDAILQRDCRWFAQVYVKGAKPHELAAGLAPITVRKALARTARLLGLPRPDRRGRPTKLL